MRSIIRICCVYTLLGILLFQCSEKDNTSNENKLAIIPLPVEQEVGKGFFTIGKETEIYIIGDQEAINVGNYLSNMISQSSTFDLSVQNSQKSVQENVIVLEIKQEGGEEEYSLNVTTDKIYISASNAVGLFYGIQSLRQLLPASIEKKDKQASSWWVPLVSIKDKPAFSWRGMHLDVSRHFFSVEFVEKFIDRLSLYKFNRLHLHLTDDQGWRLEIKKYSQLTQDGAWRVLNNQDSICIKKSVDNKDFELPQEFFKEKDGKSMYGGYYTQEEMKDIISYASERFITIVPEIDMPGHMKAALNSFPDLSCVDGSGWGKIFSIPLCPCEENTYSFVANVLGEVAALFPGEYIHIGADEVDMTTWMKSSACTSLMKKNTLKTPEELHSYFVNRVKLIVDSLGKKTIGWDEIIEGKPDSSVTVMYWRGWIPDAPTKAIERGHDVIMSPSSHFYFDYEPDHKSLEYTYSFTPIQESIPDNKAGKIKGLQANIWTETIPTTARLDYMTMPRMLALAEVSWNKNKNWESFSSRISAHYERMDLMDIKYRLKDIDNLKSHFVFIDTASLRLIKPEGVTDIRYTIDGTEPDSNSKIYDGPVRIDSSTTVKILTLGYKGRPGNRSTIRYEKQTYLPAVEVSDVQKGLSCRYYIGSYNSVNKFSERDLNKDTVVNEIEVPSFSKAHAFGLEFTGIIDIQSEGIYTFYLSSDDGSTLQIGNRMVIDNDGYHSKKEVDGQVALTKGLHPFTLKYFEGGGGGSLNLLYEGPGIKKQEAPANAFKVKK